MPARQPPVWGLSPPATSIGGATGENALILNLNAKQVYLQFSLDLNRLFQTVDANPEKPDLFKWIWPL